MVDLTLYRYIPHNIIIIIHKNMYLSFFWGFGVRNEIHWGRRVRQFHPQTWQRVIHVQASWVRPLAILQLAFRFWQAQQHLWRTKEQQQLEDDGGGTPHTVAVHRVSMWLSSGYNNNDTWKRYASIWDEIGQRLLVVCTKHVFCRYNTTSWMSGQVKQ